MDKFKQMCSQKANEIEVRPYEYAELDVEVLERVGRCRGRKLC